MNKFEKKRVNFNIANIPTIYRNAESEHEYFNFDLYVRRGQFND